MSSLMSLPTRLFVAAHARAVAKHDEQGAVFAEYAGVLLIAIALVVVVLNLVVRGSFSSLIVDLISFVLRQAITMLRG